MTAKDQNSDLKFLKPWIKWMKTKGWNVVVAGDYQVRGPVSMRNNFEFVIHFTGTKKT